jgi:hypothetical protein
MSLRKRGLTIFREFGYIKDKEARDWASRYSHFAASGITSWLDQVCPGLSEDNRKKITKTVNAGLWAGRHDAMRFAGYSSSLSGVDGVDIEDSLCDAIDRKTKGEYESYGLDQDVSIGSKVVIAIHRHSYQGFVGRVLSQRPDGKYQVTIQTEFKRSVGYFNKSELIPLRSYIRSPNAKVSISTSMG